MLIIREKVIDGIELIFTDVSGNGKYVIGTANEELRSWLENCKTRKVKASDIYFVVRDAKKFLQAGSKFDKINAAIENNYDNPIIELSELCQKKFGKNILTEVIGQSGYDHCPTVEVEITLPTGRVFYAEGSNQREAKKAAAHEALIHLKLKNNLL